MTKLRIVLFVLCLLVLIQGLSFVLKVPVVPEVHASTTVSYQPNCNMSDAGRRLHTDFWSATSTSDNFAGDYDNSTYYEYGCGMLWSSVLVPQYAAINDAYINLVARLTDVSTTAKTQFHGELIANSAAFTTSANFDARTRTTAVVNWDNLGAWTKDQTYKSANITTVIQEIVNQGSWSSGNNLTVFWDDFIGRSGNAQLKTGYNYDQNVTGSPTLFITYTDWGSPVNVSCTVLQALSDDYFLAQHGYYTFVINVTHPEGATNIQTISMQTRASTGGSNYLNVQLNWTRSTDTFANVGNHPAYVDMTNCSSLSITGGYSLTFNVKFDWTYFSAVAVYTQVETTDLHGFKDVDIYHTSENTLGNKIAFDSLSWNDTRINLGENITVAGYIVYNVVTSVKIADNETRYVYVHNSTENLLNIGGTSSGYFSLSVNPATTIASTALHVHAETVVGLASKITSSDTAIVTDRIKILTLGNNCTAARTNIGNTVQFYATAELEYDNQPINASDTLALGGLSFWFNGTHWVHNSTQTVTGIIAINSFTSGNEGFFGITLGNINGKSTSQIWDSLTCYNIQPVQYLGSGVYYYQAKVKWAYDNVDISNATVGVADPGNMSIGFTASNSTGWASFAMNQVNATSGIFSIYGVNDNNYTITVAGSNVTFTLWAWSYNIQDHEGYALGNTTFVVNNTGISVWTATSNATFYVPNSVYDVTINWLQNLPANTSSIGIVGDTTTSFNCSGIYPFNVSSVRYWVCSNASISTETYSSSILTLTFSGGALPFTLVSSCPNPPSFIVNATYDLTIDYTPYGYLVLTHYGNMTLQLSYESWSDTYVESTNRFIISGNLTGYKLYVVCTGTSGDAGVLKVHCGARSSPGVTSGFVTTSYAGTTLTGNYVFASDVTLLLDWTSYGSPGGGGGGGGGGSTGTATGLIASVIFGFPSSINKGGQLQGFLNISWTGYPTIFLWNVKVDAPYTDWRVGLPTGLPFTLNMSAALGFVSVPIVLYVPQNVTLGNLLVPCVVTLATSEGVQTTMRSVISLAILTPQVNVPYSLTLWFLLPLGAVIFFAIFRKRSKRNQ